MSEASPLSTALAQYEQALTVVEAQSKAKAIALPNAANTASTANTSESSVAVEPPQALNAILVLLQARDTVQTALEQLRAEPTSLLLEEPDLVQRLTALDDRLRQLSDYLGTQPQIRAWRQTLKPAEEAWWWRPLHPSDRWDWLWSAGTVVALTGNLALVADLAPRFLTGGPSFGGALGAIVPAVLTLLGGSSLTEAGRQLLEQGLGRLGLAEHWWQEVKFGASWGIFLVLLGFRGQLVPFLAEWYMDQGITAWEARNLTTAQEQLARSLALVEELPEAQFYLGRVYEEFQQPERALVEYEKAWQAGYLPASNNLAVLYMEEAETPRLGVDEQGQVIVEPADYGIAIAILNKALGSPDLAQESPDLAYALRKNLGQIRLAQGRYEEAEVELQAAIDLQKTTSDLASRGAAYCLMAELQEVWKSKDGVEASIGAWDACLASLNSNEPRADEWKYQAGIRLRDARLNSEARPLSPAPSPTPSPVPDSPTPQRPYTPTLPPRPLQPRPAATPAPLSPEPTPTPSPSFTPTPTPTSPSSLRFSPLSPDRSAQSPEDPSEPPILHSR